MKVLLDECMPLDLRHELRGHEAHTVQWAGFKGMKNGNLLSAAESAGYQVLVTVDQGIPHQISVTSRRLSIIVLRSATNQLDDLKSHVESLLDELAHIKPGQIVNIG